MTSLITLAAHGRLATMYTLGRRLNSGAEGRRVMLLVFD